MEWTGFHGEIRRWDGVIYLELFHTLTSTLSTWITSITFLVGGLTVARAPRNQSSRDDIRQQIMHLCNRTIPMPPASADAERMSAVQGWGVEFLPVTS
jgi:hypothetical protein